MATPPEPPPNVCGCDQWYLGTCLPEGSAKGGAIPPMPQRNCGTGNPAAADTTTTTGP